MIKINTVGLFFLLLLTACQGVLTSNPVLEEKSDDRLIGNWISKEGEEFLVTKESNKYYSKFQWKGVSYNFVITVGKIGNYNVLSVKYNFHLDNTSINQKVYFLLSYNFKNDSNLELVPLNINLIMEKIDSGELEGNISESCADNLFYFCTRIDISPQIIQELIISEGKKIFYTGDSQYLIRK